MIVDENGVHRKPPMPIVSVVVPAYNMQSYIEETLRSVLASTYPRLDVIVVDDGSTDDTAAIAERIAAEDKRVRVFRKENGGASTARNYAIVRAYGSLILPVDADNTIEPQFIERAAAVLTYNIGVAVVAPTSDYFGAKKGLMRLPEYSPEYLATENCIDNCAMYRRKDWQRVGGYRPEITTREDWAFWIAILKEGGEVVRLPEVMHHYRVRRDSKRITQRCNKRKVIDALNRLHPEFFRRVLGGPLRYSRSTSYLRNAIEALFRSETIAVDDRYDRFIYEVAALPQSFRYGSGKPTDSDDTTQRRLMLWQDTVVTAEKSRRPFTMPPDDADVVVVGTRRRRPLFGHTVYYRALTDKEWQPAATWQIV